MLQTLGIIGCRCTRLEGVLAQVGDREVGGWTGGVGLEDGSSWGRVRLRGNSEKEEAEWDRVAVQGNCCGGGVMCVESCLLGARDEWCLWDVGVVN